MPFTFVGPGDSTPLPSSAGPAGADELGVDLQALPDLDPRFPLIGGLLNLAHAIARRYQTPRGWLEDAPNYGTDLRLYLNEAMTTGALRELEHAAEAEAEKDDRILKAVAVATSNAAAFTVSLRVTLTSTFGPFALVLDVSRLTVSLLAVDNG